MVSPSRRAAAVALTLLVVLAGCSGLPASDQQSTPQPTETVERPDETVANFSYPSGWSAEGMTDWGVALRGHAHAVATVSRHTEFTITDEDYNRTVVKTFDADAGLGAARLVDTGLGVDTQWYYSPDGVFEYDHTSGELTRHPDEEWNGEEMTTVEGLRRSLVRLELSATGTVVAAGDAAVRYEVTGIEDPDAVPADDASGHVTVTEDGVIASFSVTRSYDGSTRTRTLKLSEYETATVTKPEWVPDE